MNEKFDQVFTNGKIFTSDEEIPYAEAFAVKDGKIAWIGSKDDQIIEGCKAVDLGERRIIPGIIDNHMHPIYLANAIEQIACLPPNVHSVAEVCEEVRKAAANAKKGEWIVGWGYDEGKFLERRAPLRKELDEAAPDNPVMLTRTCFHIASANSKALELAGITDQTEDPVGGKIDRDESGRATGIVRETAKNLVLNQVPIKAVEDEAAGLVKLSEVLLSRGTTAVCDSNGRYNPDCYQVYKKAAEDGFCQRVGVYYGWNYIKDHFDGIDLTKTNTENQIFVAGVKVVGDGSVSGQTAWCDRPYLGTDSCGFPVATPEDVRAAGDFAKENNIQLKYHAMGAKAIDLAVDTFYKEENWLKDGRPYVRIEHNAMPSEQAMERCSVSGIAMTMQPVFYFSEIETYLTNLGPERTKLTYPAKTALGKGVLLAFSSDAPATAWADPANPFIGMQAAVTRKAYDGTDVGIEEAVDIETAIRLYTSQSQKIHGAKGIGRLAKGYYADFVILDQDILEIPAEEIGNTQVEAVYMSGKCVFQNA